MINLDDRLRVAAAWARQANEPDNSQMLDQAANELRRLTAHVAELEEALLLIAAKKHPEQAEHPHQAIARAALKGE